MFKNYGVLDCCCAGADCSRHRSKAGALRGCSAGCAERHRSSANNLALRITHATFGRIYGITHLERCDPSSVASTIARREESSISPRATNPTAMPTEHDHRSGSQTVSSADFEASAAASAVVIGRRFPMSASVEAGCRRLGGLCDEDLQLLSKMAQEPRDAEWAKEMESNLRDHFVTAEPGEFSIRAIECRTTLCAAEVESLYGPYLGGHYSFAVTKEPYGFRVTSFKAESLQAIAPDCIVCLYANSDVLIERIRKNAMGRPQVTRFEAVMHVQLQSGRAIHYGVVLGKAVYLVDSAIDEMELVRIVAARAKLVL